LQNPPAPLSAAVDAAAAPGGPCAAAAGRNGPARRLPWQAWEAAKHGATKARLAVKIKMASVSTNTAHGGSVHWDGKMIPNAMDEEKAEPVAVPRRQPAVGCERCIYRLQGQAVCVAFPWGIPAEILDGRVDHTQPYPGDGGFRFIAQR
jgi:hypothetical protein